MADGSLRAATRAVVREELQRTSTCSRLAKAIMKTIETHAARPAKRRTKKRRAAPAKRKPSRRSAKTRRGSRKSTKRRSSSRRR